MKKTIRRLVFAILSFVLILLGWGIGMIIELGLGRLISGFVEWLIIALLGIFGVTTIVIAYRRSIPKARPFMQSEESLINKTGRNIYAGYLFIGIAMAWIMSALNTLILAVIPAILN